MYYENYSTESNVGIEEEYGDKSTVGNVQHVRLPNPVTTLPDWISLDHSYLRSARHSLTAVGFSIYL